MKKLVCLIMSMVLVLSSGITGIAAESNNYEVKIVNVEYSDHVGSIEKLNVIETGGHVYVSANELAQRLGYQCSIGEDSVMIYNKDNNEIPVGFTIFYFDSTKVSHMLFSTLVDDYEAPVSSIKDGDNAWIPLEYSLLILGSSMSIIDNTVLIDMPQKSIIDAYYDIMKNHDTYRFEWEKDFGYSDLARDIIGGSSHLINLFNGVLKFDGDSWGELFQSLAHDSSSYDSKYGENLALLLCTESDKELKAIEKNVVQMQDLLTSDGKIGKILSQYSNALDTDVGDCYQICESILKDVEAGNSSVAQYNKSYQVLEKALDKQTWFSDTGGNILEIQKGLSSALPILDVGLKVLEVAGYANEFQKQDEFSVAALDIVVSNLDEDALTFEKMKKSMKDYAEKIQSNALEYSARRYFDENVDSWIKSALGVTEALGTQANIELLAWNLASSYIPRLSDSLGAADKFELALYASIFATDAYLDYQNIRNQTFGNVENITPENLYKVSQYCYMDLKACYITRDAAIGSLKGKSYSTQEEIQPLIDQQNEINDEISEMLVGLKDANETNDGLVYGFLPSDNEKYLTEHDETLLVDVIKRQTPASHVKFEWQTPDNNGMEYGLIYGLDDSQNIVWTYQTGKHSRDELELDGICEIGIYGDNYYYIEVGEIIVLNLLDGSLVWENGDFGGIYGFSSFGQNGTLYLCGDYGQGPDFFAVDKNGKTLKKIQRFEDSNEYYWPYSITYMQNDQFYVDGQLVTKDRVYIYMDSNSNKNIYAVDPVDFSYVNLNDVGNGSNEGYSNEELCDMAKEYYEKATGNRAPEYIEIDGGDGDIVNIHLYNIVDNGSDDQHAVTHDWYMVNRADATGENITGNYIDLKNP